MDSILDPSSDSDASTASSNNSSIISVGSNNGGSENHENGIISSSTANNNPPTPQPVPSSPLIGGGNPIENESDLVGLHAAVFVESEEDDYDYDEEEEEDDEILDEEESSTMDVIYSQSIPASNNSNPISSTAQGSSATTTCGHPHCIVVAASNNNVDVEYRKAFSDLFLLTEASNGTGNNDSLNNHIQKQHQTATPNSSDTSSLDSQMNGCNNIIDADSLISTKLTFQCGTLSKSSRVNPNTQPIAKKDYDRMKFLRSLKDVAGKADLKMANGTTQKGFSLPSKESFEVLLENLNWIFGNVDDFFRLPKLYLEQLEYMNMVRLSAGDFVMHPASTTSTSISLKCRDREKLLQLKPMEVISSQCVHFLTLMLLHKFSSAYQSLKELKKSVSSSSIDVEHNKFGVVYKFIENTLEVFFNYLIGRNIFSTSEVSDLNGWSQQQRLFLSLSGILNCAVMGKPLKFNIEDLFDSMMNLDMLIVDWGLYLCDELVSQRGRQNQLKWHKFGSRLIRALKEENDRCNNPFLTLAVNNYLLQRNRLTEKQEVRALLEEYRNVINLFGDIVQVRLIVAKQLQLLPTTSAVKVLMRSCLEKAVEINPVHPEAHFLLAMYYARMSSKASGTGTVLTLKHLKSSIAVDGSNFEAVLEYCNILLGKHFRLLSETLGNYSSLTLNNSGVDRKSVTNIDIASLIKGLVEGIGSKFWKKNQIAQLKLLIFFAKLMTGANNDALRLLLPIYRDNKVLSGLLNIENTRLKYDWSSAKMTLRHLKIVFEEAQDRISQAETVLNSANNPSTSTASATQSKEDKEMKVMINFILTFIQESLPRQ